MIKKLLISGSRKASPQLLQYCDFIVERAKKNGFEIICDDSEGCSSQSWWSSEEKDVPYKVYGFKDVARNNAPESNYVMWRDGRTDEALDRFMVEQADMVVVLWNYEDTKPLQVAQYAKQLNKQVWLYVFDSEKGMTNVTDAIPQVCERFLK